MMSADLRDELRCPICLDVYTDPVNLTCGHNYCRACILRMLDTQEGSGAYNCPECRKSFSTRPVLQRNIALCNIVTILSSADPAGVHCSHCIYFSVPAVRSCLHCEASLCSNHLKVHSRSSEHVLTEPTEAPEKRKCPVHKEVLKYHCLVDDTCLCVTCCLAGEHHGHEVDLLEEASKKKKETFQTLLRKLYAKREDIEKKIRDVKRKRRPKYPRNKVTLLFAETRGETVFYTVPNLIQLFQIKKDKVCRTILHLEGLCSSSDPLSVLHEKDVDLHDIVDGREGEEWEGCGQNLHDGVRAVGQISTSQELVFDITTAASNILVSDDMKTMYMSDVYQNRPDTPNRFQYYQILSSQVFSSGQRCWDVETSNTGEWRLGVAYGRMEKNGYKSYFGDNNKSWCLRRLFKNQFSVIHDNMMTTCSHRYYCNRFRIFLDYEGGQLSFYELSNPIRHLHTVMATFTEPLHAAFGIGYWLGAEHCFLKILHRDPQYISSVKNPKKTLLNGKVIKITY